MTLTQIYNVLKKLRAGEKLDAQDEAIKTKGLVLILRELRDKLDALVAEAYGWPQEIPDEEILATAVALNAERAAEESAASSAGCGRTISGEERAFRPNPRKRRRKSSSRRRSSSRPRRCKNLFPIERGRALGVAPCGARGGARAARRQRDCRHLPPGRARARRDRPHSQCLGARSANFTQATARPSRSAAAPEPFSPGRRRCPREGGTDEGAAEETSPSSGAARHLLPQGEKEWTGLGFG